MGWITVGVENSTDVRVHYEDHGSGRTVVLVHGYPLDSTSWEKQEVALVDAGFRVISYDRRGYGRSSRPAVGYDFDTLAHDLGQLVTGLGLRDAVLVGFGTGAGEVARFVAGSDTGVVSAVAFITPILPHLAADEANPSGLPDHVFDGLESAISVDRYAFFSDLFHDFFNSDQNLGVRVSEEVIDASIAAASTSSPFASLAAVGSWRTDFRADVDAVSLPTLIMQGSEDRFFPPDATGRPLARRMPHAEYIEIEGAPHGVLWTHADEVSAALLDFVDRLPPIPSVE